MFSDILRRFAVSIALELRYQILEHNRRKERETKGVDQDKKFLFGQQILSMARYATQQFVTCNGGISVRCILEQICH